MHDESSEEPEVNLDAVKAFFLSNYIPATNLREATLMLSVEEICSRLKEAYPVLLYACDVYGWLHEGGFITADITGNMNVKWLLKSR